MLTELRPRSHSNYRMLPLFGPVLEEFVQWSSNRGHTTGTIKNQLKEIRQIVAFLQRRGFEHKSELTAAAFVDAWEHFRHPRPAVAGTVRQLQAFCSEAHMLPAILPNPEFHPHIERFVKYLGNVRGLSPSTIVSHVRYVRSFLDFAGIGTTTTALEGIQLSIIDGFVANCSTTLNRHSLQHVVGYLRAFLRFLYGEGMLGATLHEMLDTPRVYRQEKLPRSLSWETVNLLLNSIDRSDDQGIRNYAIFLLIATYGLRSCEIVSLKLEDVHWRSGELDIRQAKNNNVLRLPLTDGVANSLIDYLNKVRPDLGCREVFIRIRAPLGPLKPTAVTEAFQREVSRSNLDIQFHGAHCLRHSYAVRLLRQGNSLKAIGDILGHRSAESTCVYLRLAEEDLRCAALEPPEFCDEEILWNRINLEDIPRTRVTGKRYRPPLRSCLSQDITAYLRLHRSLGKTYAREERILRSLDAFLADTAPEAHELEGKHFVEWGATLAQYTANDRRGRMLVVRKFCLYRRREYPSGFVPDPQTFPSARSQFRAFILSTEDVARLLCAARHLPRSANSPLRPEMIELAILVLFTTGLRRGELLRLTIADFDRAASTLFVGATKFHKERIVPLSAGMAEKLRSFLDIRLRRKMPTDGASPLFGSLSQGQPGKAYTGTALRHNWRLLCTGLGILTPQGLPPRIHDIRHSFAVNTLLKWYKEGDYAMRRLPHLSTYMGHVSIVSTQRYLQFIEPLRVAAGAQFEKAYAGLVSGQPTTVSREISPRSSNR